MRMYKLVATGNDFLLMDFIHDQQAEFIPKGDRARFAREWCDRHNGIGADGFVFLEASDQVDFAWDFYNSDGSAAEMCGNAARAVSLYFSRAADRKSLRFSTRVGVVQAEVKSADLVSVILPAIRLAEWNQTLSWQNGSVLFDHINSGVPHVVVRVPQLEARDSLRELAQTIKRQTRFQPDGTNVTFIRIVSDEQIESLTFERGVEAFTLSCGTGAIAAAYSCLRGVEEKPIEVQVPGGRLSVVWKKGQPELSGSARLVGEVEVRS